MLSYYIVEKFYDLNKNDDTETVLNMLNDSGADFSTDDDAEESNKSSSESSFYNTQDQTNTSVGRILDAFRYYTTAISN